MNSIRSLLAGLLVAVSILPIISFAQDASNPICTIGRGTYVRGSRGAEVSVIQQFLGELGFLNAQPTGYFGGLTEAALSQYQISSGIISNPQDGGVFGRRTWTYVVAHSCTQTSPLPPERTDITICPAPPPQPVNVSCDSHWQKIMTGEGCHVGWSCVTYVTSSATTSDNPAVKRNYAPVIYAIQGPLSLTAGNAGTWVIRASDQDKDTLSYSMIWGDEGVNLTQLLDLSGQGTNYGSSGSFTHKYSGSGVYTMIAFVKDEPGNTNKATLTVAVATAAPVVPASTSTTTPPPVGPGSCTYNGITYASSTTIHNPICENVTTCNSSRYLKCTNGSWVPTNDPGSGGPTGSDCIMNGRSYSIGQIYGGDSTIYGDIDNGGNGCAREGGAGGHCAPSGSVICRAAGWQGSPVPGNARYGCMSSNNLFVTSEGRAYGSCTTLGEECTQGVGGKTAYFACRNDGWWVANSQGSPTHLMSTLPTIVSTF